MSITVSDAYKDRYKNAYGLTPQAIYARVKSGWTYERATTTPPRDNLRLNCPVGTRCGSVVTIAEPHAEYTANAMQRFVLCKCDCGNECVKRVRQVLKGKYLSCGCKPRNQTRLTTAEKQAKKAAWNKEWVSKNRDYRRMYLREWKRQNPGKVAQYDVDRRKRLLAFVKADREAVNALYVRAKSDEVIPCYLCGCDTNKGGRHVDHVQPISKGGAHVASNLAIACERCNLSKHAKSPEAS